MSTALRLTQNALIKEFTVASGDTATEGMAVLLDSDTEVDDAGANSDLAIGVAMQTKAAGAKVEVALFGHTVIGVKVGTGGATRGKKAKLAADGFFDAPAHDSSGGTDDAIYGTFMQSGTAGQIVGLLVPGGSNRGSV